MPSNELVKTEGIVLQATNYRDYDKILSIFTPKGLLKLFVKIGKKNKMASLAYTVPLAKAEFVYSDGQAMHKFYEATLLNSHYELRESLESLETAAKMINALQKTQMGNKTSSDLYLLFSHYLDHLSESEFPEAVYISFCLKLMKHEGILQKAFCDACQGNSSYRYGGESFCKEHAWKGSIPFSEEEEKMLLFLSECRHFSKIASFPLVKEFSEKVTSLFYQAYS